MNGMSRFLSRREKRSGKAGPGNTKNLVPLSKVFVPADNWRKLSKDEEVKVKEVCVELQQLGFNNIQEAQAEYALRTSSSAGDVKRAKQLLMILKDSLEGKVNVCKEDLALVGAENRESVTCYLDSLLFAMFARLSNFEGLLYGSPEEGPRNHLASLLRLWVNMLRGEKLITTDITKHIQEALSACGWTDAANLTQQDASEAFSFITGTLGLPLLTLKMDIYHTGKEDMDDDHKTINERLLEVAIPEESGEYPSVTLESCLEAYFNNRIEVKRHMHRMSNVQKFKSESKAEIIHVEATELSSQPSSPISEVSKSRVDSASSTYMQRRNNSIFNERYQDVGEDRNESTEDAISAKGRPRKGSLRKEVLMPAWQFFRLIPWYSENTPTSDDQVASHFASQRPILGICLKRYSVDADGVPKRRNIHVDIPLEIGLPHFVNDETNYEGGPLFVHFKLSLQSIVCHRGKSVHSGHYVALVKDNLVENYVAQSQSQVESKDSYGTWLLFDDLAKDRVQKVDIAEALQKESPYLLFYQVQPIDDATISQCNPPPYSEPTAEVNDENASVNTSTVPETSKTAGKSEQAAAATAASVEVSSQSKAEPCVAEQKTIDEQQQPAVSEQLVTSKSNDSSNKPSHNQEAAPATIIASTPTPADETKSSYFGSSRRTSKIGMRGSWSRASSQSGEGGSRLSFTIGSRRGLQASSERNSNAIVAEPSLTSLTSLAQERGRPDSKFPAASERKSEASQPSAGSAPAGSKSRKDSRRQRVSMQIERAMNEKLPDRQCLMM